MHSLHANKAKSTDSMIEGLWAEFSYNND